MKKVSWLLVSVFSFPAVAFAAANIDAAVQDICKCGFPPSQGCIDKLAPKYPEIDNDPTLQQLVMSKAQDTCGIGSNGASAAAIQDLIGKQSLDLSNLQGGSAAALGDASSIVSSVNDCSTDFFKIDIPDNWQCRKQNKHARDVTLYTSNNQLNVSVGKSQGMTSCNVLPNCTSENYTLSGKFETKQYKNPLAAGLHEYAGVYKNDNSYKLTITSMAKPTEAQLDDIEMMLDSFEPR